MSNGNAPKKVTRKTSEPLRDQILQRCRTMLISGHVIPGQKLPLRPLAEEFNTSLMPVRDALNRLVADGALELSSSRTIRVPHMSDERLVELHEIRCALEGLAGAMATPNILATSIDRMQTLIDEMSAALEANDYDSYVSRHYSFHFTLYGAANRPNLLAMIDSLWLQIGPYFRQGVEKAKKVKTDPNIGHRRIVAALRARDAKEVRASLEFDLMAAVEMLNEGVWP